MKPYPNYKPSGVEWLGDVPESWQVLDLKYICHVFPSNVDKHTHPDETPVHLCNYTDVYKNDRITRKLDFMLASATESEIEKFSLYVGDVIFTKDSETASDIGIAAIVSEDLPGVICGYHLSIARPFAGIEGRFIKYFFDSNAAKGYFAVSANGLTRVGLGQSAIGSLKVSIPPLPEQRAIAAFLDREVAKIDALIEEQRRLIALLAEKRQATISHAVTKGLDPNAKMKPSGIEWLGNIPEGWDVVPIMSVAEVIDPNPSHRNPEYVEDGFPFISTQEFLPRGHILIETPRRVSEKTLLEQEARCKFQAGSIAFSRKGTIGEVRAIPSNARIALLDSLCVINPKKQISPNFLLTALTANYVVGQYLALTRGAALPQLSIGRVRTLKIVLPPITEQEQINSELYGILNRIDDLAENALAAIQLLQERRSALISAAVTGKIDVRDLVPSELEPA